MPRILPRGGLGSTSRASSANTSTSTDVLIVCGALGSGKTRFIEELFNTASKIAKESTECWALVVTEQGKSCFYERGERDGSYYRLSIDGRELFTTVVGGGCVCCSIESSPAVVVLARTLRTIRPMRLMIIEVGLVTEAQRLIDRVRVLGGSVVRRVAAVMIAREDVIGDLIAKTNDGDGDGDGDGDEEELMAMIGAHVRGSGVAVIREEEAGGVTAAVERAMGRVEEMCRLAGTAIVRRGGRDGDGLGELTLDALFAERCLQQQEQREEDAQRPEPAPS